MPGGNAPQQGKPIGPHDIVPFPAAGRPVLDQPLHPFNVQHLSGRRALFEPLYLGAASPRAAVKPSCQSAP